MSCQTAIFLAASARQATLRSYQHVGEWQDGRQWQPALHADQKPDRCVQAGRRGRPLAIGGAGSTLRVDQRDPRNKGWWIVTSADSGQTVLLLRLVKSGDPHALGSALERERERLLRIVDFRMDRRLRNRIDPADVIQEAYIEATRRIEDYLQSPTMPFFIWLRFLVMQKLMEMHRRHIGVQARDMTREISIFSGPTPEASSAVLAAQLLGKQTSPSEAAIRAETRRSLEDKLNELDQADREVLALRHFEQLANTEVARVLNISESAASNRYVRALRRLKEVWHAS